ncbi:MAG: sortase family protein [uncultured bacterium]|uniref:Sortase n=1 Tax=Candidatus Woesebacteria bacterium RIFCSPHIGHO2_12_FULL_41_24 TaxID=1802510 RepID=A0A1F8AUC5_9BACT|nr:MAG: sortase family protein [uncultured bacterium]OGM14355.1 MAG: hypothetical protein A2W15_02290 [Candidatus Woesebacteria bacterium RBG_16_41_13]OGM34206.1 MAG: hypothetical protein A3D84_04310 [Candidatus Woesebacteria bacterium RIFCSPHIGHO2_02_FULL_42_20]OGM55337.1 MAG: hypothetical protein A3E44_03585 [Candidatus Woesebacteria bacterium RIFCSPHIGHO2_12_FULL_41_24]OGM68301.1 MAG: hypothetical protein A2969_00560 [Candidatus Woesebacteria bacterium RIFCSPLOWO2_01_FULL_42_67]OGM70019.1 M
MLQRNATLVQKFGMLLMALSIIGLLYIYLPFVKLFLFPVNIVNDINRHGYFIEIPKINAYAPIVIDVDPWKKSEYLEKLKTGVAHAKGTALPGDTGTSFLFAHSSDVPWNITSYNTAFFLLGRLKLGDEVVIYRDNEKVDYRVTETRIVSPTQASFLEDLSVDQLILQTCWPVGTDYKRLLIFAERI